MRLCSKVACGIATGGNKATVDDMERQSLHLLL